MAMPIDNLARNPGPALLYDSDFRIMFESHIPLLQKSRSLTVAPLDPQLAFKFVGDWQGLMTEMNVSDGYHWYMLRLNGMYSYDQIGPHVTSIVTIDLGVIDRLMALYQSAAKINV